MEHFHDLDPPASNWLARAYYTPVSDALRGHLSARLDVRREIAAAKLPGPISGLIYAVVRRTKLWRSEKLDVARELAAHFTDGLAAGHSNEQLFEDFGDAKQAAQLIRQAKRRSRPLYWQAWWYVSRSLVVLLIASLLGYGLLAARFYVANPTIARNYWNEINAARSVPSDQQAWPLYREAILKLGQEDYQLFSKHRNSQPGDKDWSELLAAVERHPNVIGLVRQAAAKPHLGYLLGDPADREAARKAHADWVFTPGVPESEENKHLIGAVLNGILAMRQLSRLLEADAWRAAAAGDGATLMADLSALLSMSQQFFQPRASLVEQLVAIAVFSNTMDTVRAMLTGFPTALSDAQLRDLAHQIAAYRGGEMSIDFTLERIGFEDMLQRIFTDDGHGDGRLTDKGLTLLAVRADVNNPSRWEKIVGPGVAAVVGSRRDNSELYNAYFDDMIAAHQGPAWTWDYASIAAAEHRLSDSLTGARGRMRYGIAGLFAPQVQGIFFTAERAVQQRDATEVVIALVLWHRRHGAWPDRLEPLVPDLLPAVPPDRFDGMPLRYAVRDGKPIVYSIGADRDDDGGRPSDPPDYAVGNNFSPLDPDEKNPYQKRALYDGDWILWPPIDEPQEPAATE